MPTKANIRLKRTGGFTIEIRACEAPSTGVGDLASAMVITSDAVYVGGLGYGDEDFFSRMGMAKLVRDIIFSDGFGP